MWPSATIRPLRGASSTHPTRSATPSGGIRTPRSPSASSHSTSPRNKDERIGAALDAARETPDKQREKELYGEVQQYLAEDIPYVWLYHTQISIVAAPDLVNVVNYSLPTGQKGLEIQGGSHPLYQVWRRT